MEKVPPRIRVKGGKLPWLLEQVLNPNPFQGEELDWHKGINHLCTRDVLHSLGTGGCLFCEAVEMPLMDYFGQILMYFEPDAGISSPPPHFKTISSSKALAASPRGSYQPSLRARARTEIFVVASPKVILHNFPISPAGPRSTPLLSGN